MYPQESAAKTALMLNGGTLDGSTITVTSDTVEAPAAATAKPVTPAAPAVAPAHAEGEELEQEGECGVFLLRSPFWTL